MFLKSLELNGFKSFAQKTVLEFPSGITAIVGPNGSGKSNIIDSIRWLLGEREAKNLRGAKAEDLIWNGTPKRPRLSLAQAGLHFDNSSGFFPIDFAEVAVTRRVGRDGLSEYFLNKSAVRAKDVVDFFSRSRLGTKGLIIINQGSSDLFVRVTPEERRVIIEEILGLREYQLKRAEAERKLKHTFSNLDKAKAMIEEVAPRLRLLKRQTGKWAKRHTIEEELREVENTYFSFCVHELVERERKNAPERARIEKIIEEKKNEALGIEEELRRIEASSKTREGLREVQKKKEEAQKVYSELERELARVEAKIELAAAPAASSAAFLEKDVVVFLNEIRDALRAARRENILTVLQAMIAALCEKIEIFFSAAKQISSVPSREKDVSAPHEMKKALTDRLRTLEKDRKALDEEEARIASGFEEFNTTFRNVFERLEVKRNEWRVLEEEMGKMRFEAERIELERRDLAHRVEEAGRMLHEFTNRAAPARYTAEELTAMERVMFKLRAELASIGEIDPGLVKETEEVERHHQFLVDQSRDLSAAAADLKSLIAELSKKIHTEFTSSLKRINDEFNTFFRLMFGGGSAKLRMKTYESFAGLGEHVPLEEEEEETPHKKKKEDEESVAPEPISGVEVELHLPKKRITSLDMLSGGEKSLVSIAALFALIAVSPPPFLVLDEVDAALDESNSRRFANLIKEFSKKTQFIVVTHNRSTMETADVLYGVTMAEDGCSRVLSLKLETA